MSMPLQYRACLLPLGSLQHSGKRHGSTSPDQGERGNVEPRQLRYAMLAAGSHSFARAATIIPNSFIELLFASPVDGCAQRDQYHLLTGRADLRSTGADGHHAGGRPSSCAQRPRHGRRNHRSPRRERRASASQCGAAARAASLDPQQALTFSENASLEPDGFREPNPLGFWNKRYISLAGSIFQKGVANVRPAPFVSPQGNTRTPLFRRDVIRKPETSPIPAPTATSYQ